MASPYPYIGSLNRKITIEQNTPTRGTSGQDVDSWATYKTVFAAVNFLSGTEVKEEGAPVSTSTQNFTVRYGVASGVTVKMRILYNSEYYNIRSIAAIGRNRFLTFKAERTQ